MDSIRVLEKVDWEVRGDDICDSAHALLDIATSKINGTLQFHSLSASYKEGRYMLAEKNDEITKNIISYGYDEQMVE